MDLFYRFIVFIMAILFIFTALLLSLYGFGMSEQELLPELLYSLFNRWEFGLLFFAAFVAGCWVIYPFFTGTRDTTLINESELGEINITLEALDNLVNTIALEQEGVVAINNKLKTGDEGLIINLNTRINPSKTVPQITTGLQNMVKSHIEETTGVSVSSVEVLVEDVGNGSKERTD